MIVSVVIVITIIRETKPSDPYDNDALTTTLATTIFGPHRVLTLLTSTITIAIMITTLV